MGCIGTLLYYWGRLLGNSYGLEYALFCSMYIGSPHSHRASSHILSRDDTLLRSLCSHNHTSNCKPTLWTHVIGYRIGIALLADARCFLGLAMFLGIAIHCAYIMLRKNFRQGLILIVACLIPIIYSWFGEVIFRSTRKLALRNKLIFDPCYIGF